VKTDIETQYSVTLVLLGIILISVSDQSQIDIESSKCNVKILLQHSMHLLSITYCSLFGYFQRASSTDNSAQNVTFTLQKKSILICVRFFSKINIISQIEAIKKMRRVEVIVFGYNVYVEDIFRIRCD
jgi:hypothetical protein